MNNLVISNMTIRQDADGRYRLNDLHKAAVQAGSNQRTTEPGKFFASPQTIEIVEELTTQMVGTPPVNIVNNGVNEERGTYVNRELVYAYAMWISPRFSNYSA